MLGAKVSSMELNADAGAFMTVGLSYDALNSVSSRANTGSYYTFPSVTRDNIVFPSDQPFLFKQGKFTVVNNTNAEKMLSTVDSFTLNINNSLDVRYYADGTINEIQYESY